MIASMKPRSSITSASRTYITPIRLWSTLVIHSRQRYGTQPLIATQASTPSSTRTTTEAAASGIGWSHGIAFQLSLPSMSAPSARTAHRLVGADRGPRPGRQLLHHHGVEQVRIDRAVGVGRDVPGLAGERRIAGARQGRAVLPRRSEPLREALGGHRLEDELHVGKAVAAELGRQAVERAGAVGLQVQL